jgi:hypothetical protein
MDPRNSGRSLCPVLSSQILKFFLLIVLAICLLPTPSQGQGTVDDQVLAQMIRGWGSALESGNMPALAVYYTDPIMIHPWQQRLQVAKIQKARLLQVHWIQPAQGRVYDGLPILAESEFTMEFMVEGFQRAYNETRLWGLTNDGGVLKVAYEMKKKDPTPVSAPSQPSIAPSLAPVANTIAQPAAPPAAQVAVQPTPMPQPQSAFPPLPGSNQPVVQTVPEPGTQVAENPAPKPVATPTLNENPIPRDELMQQIWDTLLTKFDKAYDYRSEQMFVRCFVKQPEQTLEMFRNDLRGKGWLQCDKIEIDASSVQGNNLNCTFRFRYSLWGPGLKRGEMREVEAAAIRGGPGWRFARFNDELLQEPARAPGYYPTNQFIQPLVSPGQPAGQRQGFSLPFLGRR